MIVTKERFLKRAEVISIIGISRVFIYQKMDPTSRYYDPTFPKNIKIGKRSARWRESDIIKWMSQFQAHG